MKKYYALYKKQFILGPAFKLAEAILELLVPLVMAKIIDVGIKNGDVPYIIKMGLLMVGLGILGLLCAIVVNTALPLPNRESARKSETICLKR